MEQRTLEYRLRAAQQRLAGIMVWLRENWTFASVRDHYDAEKDIARLERAIRKERREQEFQQQAGLPFNQQETA